MGPLVSTVYQLVQPKTSKPSATLSRDRTPRSPATKIASTSVLFADLPEASAKRTEVLSILVAELQPVLYRLLWLYLSQEYTFWAARAVKVCFVTPLY